MTEQTKIKLSQLREIGWSLCDPIGLREVGDNQWRDGGTCADEYDSYLLQAAGRLRHGETIEDVVAYLDEVEVGHIGLTRSPTTGERAQATAEAIAAYIATLPAGPLKVR